MASCLVQHDAKKLVSHFHSAVDRELVFGQPTIILRMSVPVNLPKCEEITALLPAKDLERRRELGQFFTSPNVAEFIWKMLEIIHGARFRANTRLIDPACGEGVFLRVANEQGGLPTKSLFGADIDATLVPLWQQDSLLRGASLVLGNGLLDDPSSGIIEGAFHVTAGNPPFSGKGLRDLLRLLDEDAEGQRHQEQDLFGGLYVKEESTTKQESLPAEERSELDRLIRSLSQYSCWRLQMEPEQEVEEEDDSKRTPTELFAPSMLEDRRRPTVGDYERAAKLISQWPHNRPLDTSLPEIRDTIRRLASTAIEVMFTERFVRLTKPGGLIAVIVPESIVASDRLGPFRIWLLGRMDLLASVSLPQKVFTGVGANAKTSIIFGRRRVHDRLNGWYSSEEFQDSPEDNDPVFLAAPRVDAPSFTVDSYLAHILADAQRERNVFWPKEK